MNKVLACVLFAMVVLPRPGMAQDAAKPFTPEQLDQIVAPIALHPDALLAQLLMASTYPLEIVQAARFVKANPNLTGEPLNAALREQAWDDSVKSLATFPQVLTMMNEKLDWLQKLGDAFLAQQQEVMAAIQRLRARAQSEGQLKSTPEQKVTVEPSASPATAASPSTTVEVVQAAPTVIRIEPTNPDVVYVPNYDPTVVYGAFPPAYPPYSPYPWGYFAAGAFTFMAGAAVGGALWGDCDWGHGDVNINNERVNHFSNNVNNRQEARARVDQRAQNRTTGAGGRDGSRWQHNPEHRKGVQYRDSATQQRFNRTGPANAQSREAFRGRAGSGEFGGAAGQGGFGGAGGREGGRGQQGGFGQLGQQQGGFGQQGAGGLGDRGGQASPRTGGFGQGGGEARRSGAFEGMGGGRDAQSFSNRGNASRESFSRSAGGSRGGSGSVGAARSSGGGARAGGGGGARGGGGGRGGGGRR